MPEWLEQHTIILYNHNNIHVIPRDHLHAKMALYMHILLLLILCDHIIPRDYLHAQMAPHTQCIIIHTKRLPPWPNGSIQSTCILRDQLHARMAQHTVYIQS